MLNFRNTNIFFVALLAALIYLHVQSGMAIYIYVIILIVYSLVLFYGCYYVGSNFFIRVVCKANTREKEIAISFDDGPASSFTPELLEVLETEAVPATFFCIGNRVAGNEGILKKVQEKGHIIGNHSYSHAFWFDMFGSGKMLADMKQAEEEIERVTGLKPKLFRPPYGVTNPNLAKAIRRGGYTPVGWSVRSMDTVIKDPAKLLENLSGSVEPGNVFLFHDTSAGTLRILAQFIRVVKNQGFRIVPLDKLLHLTPYA